MNTSARRTRFRAILAGDACVHPASVHDPIAARIATDLGFETAMFAGSIASIAVLGAPDLILVTLTEFAEQARRICRAGAPPLMVDADHGYGNALNVMRTVQELETAGVAMTTAVTSGSAQTGSKSARAVVAGKFFSTKARRSGHESTRNLTRHCESAEKLRSKLGPQYPQPIWAIFIVARFIGTIVNSFKSWMGLRLHNSAPPQSP
jgi:hypothetical protein